jgi:hypothetical protein
MAKQRQRGSLKLQRAKSSLARLARKGVGKEIARAIPTTREGEEPAIEFQADHTQIYTYFTQVGGTRLLYNAERYVTLILELENAGPVSIGTSRDLTPVLSGKGTLLPTDRSRIFEMSKGDRLYIAAETVNRVQVYIEPIPYLRQIYGAVVNNTKGIVGAVLAAVRPKGPAGPTSTSGKRPDELPCPPGDRRHLPKLPRRRKR